MNTPKLTPALFEQIARGCFTWFDFTIDEHNQEPINYICQWANEDPEFEKSGRCLGKGLVLLGNPGSGKTKLLEVLQMYFNQYKHPLAYHKTQIWKEARDFKQSGDVIFNKFLKGHWMYDELRRKKDEELVAYFGNKVDMGRDMIYFAYERFTGPHQWMSHFTTNMTKTELRTTFDDLIELGNGETASRAFSRLTEMCNFIQVLSPFDRRERAMPRRKTVFQVEEDIELKKTIATKDVLQMICIDYRQWEALQNIACIRIANTYYDTLEKLGLIDLSTNKKKALMEKANTNIKDVLQADYSGKLYDLKNLMTDISTDPKHTKVVTLAKTFAIQDFFSIVQSEGGNIEEKLQLTNLNPLV
jgi:hypothetical protein